VKTKKVDAVLKLAFSLVWLFASAFASSEYVIVNSNNYVSNSAVLYKLNTKTGKLSKAGVLDTGGQGSQNPQYFFQFQQAVSPEASCIFVLNSGSSDIAAFSKPNGYKRVGRYFKSELIAGDDGGSLALAPSGKFLYVNYGVTSNIGLWSVNSDCTLIFVAAYGAATVAGPIKVTPNGKYLVLSGNGGTLYSIGKTDGSLTNLGAVTFDGGACARIGACEPHGFDITKDSKFVVFASNAVDITRQHAIAVALTARITSAGPVNPRVWVLKNSSTLYAAMFPFFGAGGYAGSGDLFFGVSASGPPGVLTTAFTEHPMSFKLKNATLVKAPDNLDGNIAVTGNLMVIAEYPNQIGVFRIQKDGSLKLLTTKSVDEQGEGLFSLSIFPNTR